MQEASELVGLRFDLNRWSRILAHKLDVSVNLRFKVLHGPLNFVDQVLLLKHIKVLLVLVQPRLRLNAVVDVLLEVFHLIERACREVLRRRVVLLDRLQVADDDGRAVFLLVNDALKVIELTVHLGCDLVFEALLVANLLLHVLTFLQIAAALLLDLLQVLNVHIGGLLQSQRLTPVFLVSEVTFVAQGCIVRNCNQLNFIQVIAKLHLFIILSYH